MAMVRLAKNVEATPLHPLSRHERISMESKKLAQLCRELADNKKGEDILVLDVRDLSSVTDYFVLVSGSSEPHLRAISDEIIDRLKQDYAISPRARDGTIQGGWVVLDLFDVIVHIMRTEARTRYDLESLWGDAPRLKPPRRAMRGEGRK
jgi:ribosome-associated protein